MAKVYERSFLMSKTGRYFVRVGKRTFCVEPITLRNQKMDDKTFTNGGIDQVKGGSVTEEESIIKPENGFKNIVDLPAGVSPDSFIEQLTKQT